jgi:hypothetical protein
LLDTIEIDLRGIYGNILTVYIDVEDNSLSRKWLPALNYLVQHNHHLEKNYCWLGWANGDRSIEYICEQINRSITVINSAGLGYTITDSFTPENTVSEDWLNARTDRESKGWDGTNRDHMNQLHRYFEDLQGTSGAMSPYYTAADEVTRWHIRQLNLLCHEHESLVLSIRRLIESPEWRRPSQLMCWLQAPRFILDAEDYELFGIETINRSLGGVYVGVNKAVGKHHWEVFNDEGRDSRVGELVTSALRSQTEAAGDFDIEWARDPGSYDWQIKALTEFRTWLVQNNFDPDDKSLTIGHPKVAQVDLIRSFGTTDHDEIWRQLATHLDVYKIRTSCAQATYEYRWSDEDYELQQIRSMR